MGLLDAQRSSINFRPLLFVGGSADATIALVSLTHEFHQRLHVGQSKDERQSSWSAKGTSM
jgi:hypothetical protein